MLHDHSTVSRPLTTDLKHLTIDLKHLTINLKHLTINLKDLMINLKDLTIDLKDLTIDLMDLTIDLMDLKSGSKTDPTFNRTILIVNVTTTLEIIENTHDPLESTLVVQHLQSQQSQE